MTSTWRNTRRDTLALLGVRIEDLCSGVALIGTTGSGKSSVIELLCQAILQYKVACCWLGVKPEEVDRACSIIEKAGRREDLIRLKPGGDVRFNIAGVELTRPGGSPQTLARMLSRVNRINQRDKGEARASEQYWETLIDQSLEYAIFLCYLALGDSISLADIYYFIISAPATPEISASDEHWDTFCGRVMIHAKAAAHTDSMKEQWERACAWFKKTIPMAGDKAYGAVLAGISGLLAPFVTSPLYETCCSETSFTPQDVTERGKLLVLDYDVITYGDAGRTFQLLVHQMVMDAALQRRITAESPYVMFVRDEFQWLADATYDVRVQTVARSQGIIGVVATQSLPVLVGGFGGGPKAQQDAYAMLGCHANLLVLSNSDPMTNQYFSSMFGERKEMMMSLGKGGEKPGFVDDLLGVGSHSVSFSTQWRPHVKPADFARLPKGGTAFNGVVGAYYHVAGKVFPDRRNHKLVYFLQDWKANEQTPRKRRWFGRR